MTRLRGLIAGCAGLALVLLLSGVSAFAQGVRVEGQVIDQNGQPYQDVTVTISNTQNGQHFTLKTDKNGNFGPQLGLSAGIYDVKLAKDQFNFDYGKVQMKDGDNKLSINLKALVEAYEKAHPEDEKKRNAAAEAQKQMKTHFDNGLKAIQAGDAVADQIKTAPPDQKNSLNQQRTTDCQTASNEFQEALKGVDPKETKNQVVILSDLGQADECAGKFDDAVAAFQKVVALSPEPQYYTDLATNLAKSASALTDPSAATAKMNDASAACDKATQAASTATDPNAKVEAARCWRNVGIVAWNKGDGKTAAPAFQKAAQANPNDAQTWLLLGDALAANIDYKQEGGKLVPIYPAGIREAFQKAASLAPNTPIAAEAQQMLTALDQESGGTATTVTEKKKKH